MEEMIKVALVVSTRVPGLTFLKDCSPQFLYFIFE